jgi:uncharacterized protein YbaA (DUF1428 family)
MNYVDGFVLPLPAKNLKVYRQISQKAGEIWREHGALEYRECAADDLKTSYGNSFTQAIKLKPGETVLFSWIVFKSRAHRDLLNARVEKDPRMAKMMEGVPMPFELMRMVYGGFKVLVDV